MDPAGRMISERAFATTPLRRQALRPYVPTSLSFAKTIWQGTSTILKDQSKDLAPEVVNTMREHLLNYVPDWTNVYGAFRPYYFADVQTFYHQLSELPGDEI